MAKEKRRQPPARRAADRLRQESPWETPEELSLPELEALARFIDAANCGRSQRECCRIAFGSEEKWRQKAFALLQAGLKRTILKFDPTFHSTFEHDLRAHFGLQACGVVALHAQRRGSLH